MEQISLEDKVRDMLSKYAIGKDDECEWHSTSYRVPKTEFEKEEL